MAAETDQKSAIARKLSVAQDDRHGDTRSILRALRLALARAADETAGLALSVIGATQARRDRDELGRSVPEGCLYLLLENEAGALGAACLDRSCVTAILQQQTMGQVFDLSDSDRPFTGTDAAMAAPLIDVLLSRGQEECDLPADRRCLAGSQFAAKADNRRGLILALEAEDYRVFDLTLEIAGGKGQGRLTLLLPDLPEPTDPESGEGTENPGRKLDQSFGVMRAELSAVISRVRLPLSAFSGMRPGDLLPLIGDKLDRTEILTIEGQQIALARLGQCRGMRAVRLNEKRPDPTPVEDPPALFEEQVALPANTVPPGVQTEPPTKNSTGTLLPSGSQEDAPEQGRFVDVALPAVSPDLAAAEISQLAGLAGELDEE